MDKRIILFFPYLCLALAMGLTEEDIIKFKDARAACIESTGVSEDLILAINTDGTFADDEKLKCYVMCVHKKLGLMEDNGIMDVETIIKYLPEDLSSKYASRFRSCGTIYGANLCETAWLTVKCYAENIHGLPHP